MQCTCIQYGKYCTLLAFDIIILWLYKISVAVKEWCILLWVHEMTLPVCQLFKLIQIH